MIEVKAYVCSYCDGNLTTDYNSIIEHEKRCIHNPDRKICSCLRCIHGDTFHREETGYRGRKITRAYAKCNKGIGNKFDYIYDYCEEFAEKETEFLRISRQKGAY